MRPEWWNRAACAGQPLEIFFPETSGRAAQKAKAFCKVCPVQTECLEDTLKAEDPSARHGVFGGMTNFERKKMFGGSEVSPLPEQGVA